MVNVKTQLSAKSMLNQTANLLFNLDKKNLLKAGFFVY